MKIFINCAYAAWTAINCHLCHRRCRFCCLLHVQQHMTTNHATGYTHAHTLAHHKAAKGSSDPSMIYNHAAAARFPRPAIKATSCGRVCSLSVCLCCVDNRRKIVTFPWSLSSDSAANRKSARENFSKATS